MRHGTVEFLTVREGMASPLVVTGSHRSGSTWVGRSLALSDTIAYIDEPFHPGHRPGTCAAIPRHWYQYVTEANEHEGGWRRALGRTFELRYDLAAELRALRWPRDVGRAIRDASRFGAARRRGARALLKDPLAFFSAPWIARQFGAKVVVITRHPAAFASSLKRLDWRFDIEANWLDQELLVDEVLGPWHQELATAHAAGVDVIDEAALCWKVIASVTLDYQRDHPDWIFVRHEDLSREPVREYRALFERLEVPWSAAVEAALRATTSSTNPAEAPTGTAHALRRDSAANISNWKQRLEPAEVERIRAGVDGVGQHFYGDEDW